MYTQLLAALLIGTPGGATVEAPPPPRVFNAYLDSENEHAGLYISASGGASFQVTDAGVAYQLNLAPAGHVINVGILVQQPKGNVPAVELFTGPTPQKAGNMVLQGRFSAKDVHGVTMEQLLAAMQNGKASVAVLTQEHPSGELIGAIHGGALKLAPAPISDVIGADY